MIGKQVLVGLSADELKGHVEVVAKVVGSDDCPADWRVQLDNGQIFDIGSQQIERVLTDQYPNIKRMERYLRKEDMSPDGKLCMVMEDDGDICLSIIRGNNGRNKDVQFCSIGSGGGKSRHTLEALRNLMHAIELDNKEYPL